jgi:F-type H+-transporting ATPase subunit b
MEILNALGNIGFDWRLALANLVNFLIVFWLLKKFVWAPLRAHIENREKEIAQGLENAQKAETALVMAKEKSDSIIDEAKVERNKVLKEARTIADQTIAQSTREAMEKSDEILQMAQKNAEGMEARALDRVKERAVDLIIAGTRSALKDEVSTRGGDKVIDTMLKQV